MAPPRDRPPRRAAADGRAFPFIDAWRGVAAAVILAHHLFTYVPRADAKLAGLPLLHDLVWWHGGLATQVFLVISGFVAGVSLARRPPTAAALGGLLLVRYLRLAVPAVATLLAALGAHAVVPAAWAAFPLFDELTLPGVLAHLLFLQDVLGYPSLLAGFWYLAIDWQCHALLGLLVVADEAILRRLPALSRAPRGAASVALPLLVALPSLCWWNGAAAHEPYATYFFGIMFLGTLAGMAVAGDVPPVVFWAYGAAGAVAVAAQPRPQPAVALAAGLAIYLLARAQPPAAARAGAPLHRLGRLSYAVFLVHYPMIWMVASVARGFGGEAAAASWPCLAAAIVASLAAAVLLHRLVEVPTLALVGRLKSGWRPLAEGMRPGCTVGRGRVEYGSTVHGR